ncbi:MAG: respiratory nitrate reductase subunit gamma [Rothia dentocariosa]|nr:respiratory nitrate reductase subunit gamma [Rothia dentocariosa]
MYALASEHAAHGVPVPVGEPGIVDILLWGVLPYVTILILIGGTIWRYRTDQFSWTTRSSQIYESKMLRLGSPLFHYGLAAVFMGHVGGLVVPKMLTDYVVDDHTYHIVALVGGSAAALATIAGLALLLWRRRNNAQVFTATTANDKFMYFVLVAVILAGTAATLFSAINPSGGLPPVNGHEVEFNYRTSIAVWFRSIFYFHPEVALMVNMPLSFKIHIIAAMVLFIIWPFTRLVHALTMPLHYLFRPYTIYRSRGGERVGARRGWDPIGTHDREDVFRR